MKWDFNQLQIILENRLLDRSVMRNGNNSRSIEYDVNRDLEKIVNFLIAMLDKKKEEDK